MRNGTFQRLGFFCDQFSHSRIFRRLPELPRQKHSEAGTAMLELAVVLPLYIIIFFGVIDLGQAIRQQTVFEGLVDNIASLEARIAELEPNVLYTNVHTGSPTACPPISDCPGHRLVQDQFRRLFSLHGWNVGPGEAYASLSLQSRYIPFDISNPISDFVTLEAWGTYSGVIPAVARTVSAKVQFPYLYDDITGFGLTARARVLPLNWSGFTADDKGNVVKPPDLSDSIHPIHGAKPGPISIKGIGGGKVGLTRTSSLIPLTAKGAGSLPRRN